MIEPKSDFVYVFLCAGPWHEIGLRNDGISNCEGRRRRITARQLIHSCTRPAARTAQ